MHAPFPNSQSKVTFSKQKIAAESISLSQIDRQTWFGLCINWHSPGHVQELITTTTNIATTTLADIHCLSDQFDKRCQHGLAAGGVALAALVVALCAFATAVDATRGCK
jgi:hypothetical protein